jgi:hypothetical protein
MAAAKIDVVQGAGPALGLRGRSSSRRRDSPKLLINVILSSIFGSYADRRLMIAALDTTDPAKLFERATATKEMLKKNSEGAVWIDFVADLGDGFDSTYAVASLLAQRTLKLGEVTQPRGQALFMGGDEVYPKATENAYRYQLRMPYVWASPNPNPKSEVGVPLYAVLRHRAMRLMQPRFLSGSLRRSASMACLSWSRRSAHLRFAIAS